MRGHSRGASCYFFANPADATNPWQCSSWRCPAIQRRGSAAIDTTNPAVAINEAHGLKVESTDIVRRIADSMRNDALVIAGKAQSAVNKVRQDLQGKASRALGRAQGAIEQVRGDVN